MICDACGNSQVVVEITEIAGGGVRQLRLCSKCAAERGVETSFISSHFPQGGVKNPQAQLTSFLQTVQQQLSQGPQGTEMTQDDLRCAFCSSTFKDFRSTGRLGCAHCYQTFESGLRDLLRRVHGNSRHVGRRYEPPAYDAGSANAPVVNVHQLRDRLRRAIESEEFELAANLRDKLRSIE